MICSGVVRGRRTEWSGKVEDCAEKLFRDRSGTWKYAKSHRLSAVFQSYLSALNVEQG